MTAGPEYRYELIPGGESQVEKKRVEDVIVGLVRSGYEIVSVTPYFEPKRINPPVGEKVAPWNGDGRTFIQIVGKKKS